MFTSAAADRNALGGTTFYFPFEICNTQGERQANLSAIAKTWLSAIGVSDANSHAQAASDLWLHTLAILYAPRYLVDNGSAASFDWPRIPLPNEVRLLERSSALGERIAQLLDTSSSYQISKQLQPIGLLCGKDLEVTAGWGNRNSQGVLPKAGRKAYRAWQQSEQKALQQLFKSHNIPAHKGFKLLGDAVDVYLNDTTFWQGVPDAVWNYWIGNYQVVKKWLSYRDSQVLGRTLKIEEVREVSDMVKRILELILISDELDKNYIAVTKSCFILPDKS